MDGLTRNLKSRPERPRFTVRAGRVGRVGTRRGQGPQKHSDRTRLYSETAREAQSLEAARAVLRLAAINVDLGLPRLGYWWSESAGRTTASVQQERCACRCACRCRSASAVSFSASQVRPGHGARAAVAAAEWKIVQRARETGATRPDKKARDSSSRKLQV